MRISAESCHSRSHHGVPQHYGKTLDISLSLLLCHKRSQSTPIQKKSLQYIILKPWDVIVAMRGFDLVDSDLQVACISTSIPPLT